jgi:hypothetical protein
VQSSTPTLKPRKALLRVAIEIRKIRIFTAAELEAGDG